MRRLHYLAAASALVLSACGGGDSGSGGGAGMPPVTVTPTPTPAPTPTPTPTPPPSYVVTDYNSTFALSSKLGYLINYADDVAAGSQNFASGTLLQPSNNSVINYNSTSLDVGFSYNGVRAFFTGSDRVIATPYQFFRNGSENIVLNLRHEMSARYVTVASWWTNMPVTVANGSSVPGARYRTAMFGTPSSPNDPLIDYINFSGSVMFEGGIAGQRRHVEISGASNVNWSYTVSNRRVFGSIPYDIFVNGTRTGNGLLMAEGSFDAATNSMSGTLTDSDKRYQGSFSAQMYGPNRAELGIVFTFSGTSDGSTYFGNYIGKRTT